jgi:hypothetical protein
MPRDAAPSLVGGMGRMQSWAPPRGAGARGRAVADAGVRSAQPPHDSRGGAVQPSVATALEGS